MFFWSKFTLARFSLSFLQHQGLLLCETNHEKCLYSGLEMTEMYKREQRNRWTGFHFTLLFFSILTSCAPKVPFVWVDCLPIEDQKALPYQIQTGDQVEVSVWNQPQISGTFSVREDGNITVPLIGDISVKGLQLSEASEKIAAELEGGIVKDVRVVLISRAVRAKMVSVLGEVRSPGQVQLLPEDTLIDVIAKAGDITEFADKNAIYVFRAEAKNKRIRFNYNRLKTLRTGGIHFRLRPGDVIIVE